MMRFVLTLLAGLCLTFSAAHAQQVKLTTTLGDITVELESKKAPNSVQNFLRYVREGAYDGTVFHRVMPGFMIQGGGFNKWLEKKDTHPPIDNEANNGLKNRRGTVAMARTGNPHSATAQFFINVVNNVFLDHTSPSPQGWGYAVFAKVIDGMDVVDRIAASPTGDRGGLQNVPTTAVVITSATVVGE